MKQKHTIVTISHRYGGGRESGRRSADELGTSHHDRSAADRAVHIRAPRPDLIRRAHLLMRKEGAR